MRLFQLLFFVLYLQTAEAAPLQPADVMQSPSCRLCGMDRAKFQQSRMVIEYQDGSTVATCSLHCVAVELANSIDRIPVMVRVADYDNRQLVDAESATWVVGGSQKGVMTAQAKWAFAGREPAEEFVKRNGGSIVSFDEVMKAAYDDMYQDTKMIRELREMKRVQRKGASSSH